MLYFERLKLINLTLNRIRIQLFHSNARPDPASQYNAYRYPD
jgi:hypothetical protein